MHKEIHPRDLGQVCEFVDIDLIQLGSGANKQVSSHRDDDKREEYFILGPGS